MQKTDPINVRSDLIRKARTLIKKTPALVKKNIAVIVAFLAWIVPLTLLYSLYPASFEATWKGRTYYIFFVWLLLLETILNWEMLNPKRHDFLSKKTIITAVTLAIPTVYVIVANFTSLNNMIIDASPKFGGDPFWANLMPLTVEYLVFAVAASMMMLTIYGLKGLKNFALSISLISVIGLVYLTDNLFPYGAFTPFQIIVPATTNLASAILNLAGYTTTVITGGQMPFLQATSPSRVTWGASIGWPCSGVESLLIYTIITVLFLKRMTISLRTKTLCFVLGASVTYLVNALRIVTIFTIATNGGDWSRFHDYYGQLYSITWIVSYPLIIWGSRALWTRIRSFELTLQGRGAHASREPSLSHV